MIAAEPQAAARPGRRGAVDRPRFLIVVAIAAFVFLFLPIAVVVLFSFNSERSLQSFGHFDLRWYRAFFDDDASLTSLRASLGIAVTASVPATVIGTALALGIARAGRRLARPFQSLVVLTLVTPEIATAVAFLLLLTALSVQLSNVTVVLGHITFSIGFVVVLVSGRLGNLNTHLEEAAMDLGATRLQTLRLVVLPQIAPAVVGAALLTFVLSFGDFVTSLFVSGADVSPLPVRIYGMLRTGVTPQVNAIGTLMTLVTVVLGILAYAVLMRRRRSES